MLLVLFYFLCSLLIFIISVVFLRWVFEVDKIADYQRRQYMLLRQIAEKSGVETDLIREIDNL